MKMPVVFIGHGSPVNILADNSYTRSLYEVAAKIPKPKAVLVISAHWQTRKSYVSYAQQPATIYDFYGFPAELYQVRYDCPGAFEQAVRVREVVGGVESDLNRGLDHAAWAVLRHMYPSADIPVTTLSLDIDKSPWEHYELGQKLTVLRDEGVLILGSGNIVHNLRRIDFDDLYGRPYSWAEEFDRTVKALLSAGDHKQLIEYEKLPQAKLAVPTDEHYLPMLYAIALQQAQDTLVFACEDIQNGSISMRSFIIQGA